MMTQILVGKLNTLLRNQTKAMKYSGLVLRHLLSQATLKRVPEPHRLTDQPQHVEDYSRAIDSVMVLPYVLVLDMVARVMGETHGKNAIDLCCGPGHFTRMLVKHLDVTSALGVDLSEPMLKKAQENAQRENLETKLKYLKMDVTNLKSIAPHSLDIVSFMDGAHHMDTLDQVRSIFLEANRVAKRDGMIIMIDPVRPKTNATAESYHRIAGQAYVDLGLDYFNQDFRDSLHASWSTDEMFQAIPKDTNRQWVHIVPFGFPSFQIVIGLPEGQTRPFHEEGLSKELVESLIPPEAVADWRMLKMSFALATHRYSTLVA